MNQLIQEVLDGVASATKDPEVAWWEREVVQSFGMQLQLALDDLQTIEQVLAGTVSNPPPARERFVELLSIFGSIPARMKLPSGCTLGDAARKHLSALWSKGLTALDEFVKNHKDDVGIKAWSIAATFGFPIGVSGTISVTFDE